MSTKSKILATLKADRLACRMSYAQQGACHHVSITITKRAWYSGLWVGMCFYREWLECVR